MKKLLVFSVVLALLFSFTACTATDSPEKENYSSLGSSSSDNKQGETASTDSKAVFGLNETAVFKDSRVTAIEIKESKGDGFFKPDDGNVFVGVKFVIENTSNESVSISSILQFDAYADDVAVDYSISAATVFDKGVDGDIASGKRIEGWYTIEVPTGYKNIDIYFTNDILSSVKTQFSFNK